MLGLNDAACHAFNAEWCLDLHGFLNRDEFNTQLNEINDYTKKYPLLSEKAKDFLSPSSYTFYNHRSLQFYRILGGKNEKSIKGRATPKYAEHAEIALEIHDALSDLTANTVRVKIAADAIS
ncbi:3886_t:CDS:2 [Ambispora leptoticha]|uniref:3886_t:CDS:1 n=1 Tax=Ambispora leptoticha TaxID=144679 RepID=A0A9N8VNS4_9GLOM|nr:3886_t:CDS:2 [Ambispora leptoticha]